MTEDGLFDVQIWGTVGQWFAALGTLFLGGLNIWLARRGDRRANALERQAAIRSLSMVLDEEWNEDDFLGAHVVLFNAGSTPLKGLRVKYKDYRGAVIDLQEDRSELRPGAEWRFLVDRESTYVTEEWTVEATDIHGASWKRSLAGEILELKGSRPRRWWQFWRRGQ